MSHWLVVHSRESFKINSRVVGFNSVHYNAKNIKKGDILVYYISESQKEAKGIYKVIDISKTSSFETKWKSNFQFLIEPLIELSSVLDFSEIVDELESFSYTKVNWYKKINGVHSVKKLSEQDFKYIEKFIKSHYSKENLDTYDDILAKQNRDIEVSRNSGKVSRQERLRTAKTKPEVTTAITKVYTRNPDVIVEVLERANGICEECNKLAPFMRSSDGTPYLEVHHKIPLSKGGDDTVLNAQAVCPNCHSKLHFG